MASVSGGQTVVRPDKSKRAEAEKREPGSRLGRDKFCRGATKSSEKKDAGRPGHCKQKPPV